MGQCPAMPPPPHVVWNRRYCSTCTYREYFYGKSLFWFYMDLHSPFLVAKREFFSRNGSAPRRCSSSACEPSFSRPHSRVCFSKLERRRAGEAGEDPGRLRAGHHDTGHVNGIAS